MPNSFNAQGLTISTSQELLANKTNIFKKIYGSDIDLSSNTEDGQIVNIDVQATSDNLELIQSVNNSFDPDNAVGVQADQRCAINGVFRQEGTFSITPIEIVLVKPNMYLYGLDQADEDVYFIYDNTGNKWLLIQSQLNVGPGTIFCDFRAENPGENITIPNTINIPGTVILGVSSVNNPTAQTVRGINEESDGSLKARRAISVSLPSQGYQPGLKAALLNIPGISSAEVYENRKGYEVDGIPGHCIWVIVEGSPIVLVLSPWGPTITYSYGDIVSSGGTNYISWKDNNINNPVTNPQFWGIYNPIAQDIYIRRNSGCDMLGDVSYNITQKDGQIFTINYDIVIYQNLFIAFTATSIDGINPPNIEGIIEKLVSDYILGVNEEVNINQMATIVQKADPNCLVTNAGLGNGHTQIANLSGIAASGTFKFVYNGNSTSFINWNDSTTTIQTKLRLVTGLENCIVSGSISSQSLTINLNSVSALSLISVIDNTLETSAPAPITFSFNEGYQNILLPSTKKNKFIVNAENITILPMILSPSSITLPKLDTQQFKGLGGNGTKTYSIQSNVSGGSINPSSGLYTAGSTVGNDVVKVTDVFGNTATATVTVQ